MAQRSSIDVRSCAPFALVCRWAVLVLVLSGCGAAPSASEVGAAGAEVAVELDVYSGRPNPLWDLSAEEATVFLQKIAALPEASAEPPTNDLGYRGFVVRVDHDETVITVQNGTLQSVRAGATTYRGDPGRDVERWLLDTGKPVLDDDIVTLVESELTG